MKKVALLFFAIALSCAIYAQTAVPTAGSEKVTISGNVSKKAYEMPAAPGTSLPNGVSGWVVEFNDQAGRPRTNGVSKAEAEKINAILASGKKVEITVVRTDGGKDQISIASK